MTDEKFLYVSDVAEKKRIARGSHNKRAHAGKGGSVKLPSDFYSRKELQAMNGEVKSYRLNEPMTWVEFKALPDDIKIMYIKALREKFGVTDKKIFEQMYGVSKSHGSKVMKGLGLSVKHYSKDTIFDKDGWEKWLNRASKDIAAADQDNEEESSADAENCEPVESEKYDVSSELVSALTDVEMLKNEFEVVKREANALRIQLDAIKWTLETIFGRDGNA